MSTTASVHDDVQLPLANRGTGSCVPAGWEVTPIGDVCRTSSGTTPSRRMYDRYYREGSVPWVRTMDLNNSDIVSTDECVTELALDETVLRVYPVGTVLIAMYGGFNQIGRTGLLRIPAAVNQAITAIQPDAKYLASEFLLATLNYHVDYWMSVASSSRKDPNITGQDVREFPVLYPTRVEEQRAIAAALADVDALISALDKLIAKKRAIKLATMQQLLTGKARLPGFIGEWRLSPLGDVLSRLRNGAVYKPSDSSGWKITRIETIASGSIDLSRVGYATPHSQLEDYKLQVGDVLFSHINSVDHIGKVALVREDHNLYHGMNLLLLRAGDQLDSRFLFYWLGSEQGRKKSASLAKQAVSQASINTSELNMIEIPVPLRQEQTSICDVLADMDAEITALERRRDKTKAIKQGMMQELLMGRTRLL